VASLCPVQLYWHRKEKLITLVPQRVALFLCCALAAGCWNNEKSKLALAAGKLETHNARDNVWARSQKHQFCIVDMRENRLDEIALIL